MKNSKILRLAIDAMLAAMYVVLSLISISFPNMKITLDSLPILIGAALLGPLDGMSIGLIGSFINQMITYGFSVTTLLWILPAGVRGLMVGAYAKHKKFEMTRTQTVFITVLSALVVTALNTLVMYIDSKIFGYYSYAYVFGAMIPRIIAGVITAVVFAVLLPELLKILRRHIKLGKFN